MKKLYSYWTKDDNTLLELMLEQKKSMLNLPKFSEVISFLKETDAKGDIEKFMGGLIIRFIDGVFDIKDYKIVDGVYKGPEVYVGDLSLTGSGVKDLGFLRHVKGFLSLYATEIVSLGKLKYVDGGLEVRETPIEDVGDLEKVLGNFILCDTKITDLGGLHYVGQSIDLRGTTIESLGDLRYVGIDLTSPIASLVNLEFVGRDIVLKKSKIDINSISLDNLRHVGGGETWIRDIKTSDKGLEGFTALLIRASTLYGGEFSDAPEELKEQLQKISPKDPETPLHTLESLNKGKGEIETLRGNLAQIQKEVKSQETYLKGQIEYKAESYIKENSITQKKKEHLTGFKAGYLQALKDFTEERT